MALTGRDVPGAEESAENGTCDLVGDEVKVKVVLAVEKHAFDEGHDVTR